MTGRTRLAPVAGGWRADLLALAGGALLPAAHAPLGLWPVAMLAVLALLASLHGASLRSAAVRGWLWGVGAFGVGVSWVQASIHDFGLPVFAFSAGLTAIFVMVLACYPLLLALLLGTVRDPVRRALLALPGLWLLVEWLRARLFTGFPWLALGDVHTDSPLAALLPLVGASGLGLCTALHAGALACLYAGRSRTLALVLLVVPFVAAGLVAGVEWTPPAGPPLAVAVVQGNIEQQRKFLPEERERTLAAYLDLTRPLLGRDLVLWPETAIPAFQIEVEDYLRALHAEAEGAGTTVMVGVPFLEAGGRRYFNSVLALGGEPQVHHKHHLVPFGEYLPFDALIRPWLVFWNVPMSAFSAGAPDQPAIRVGEARVALSICFEDAFPGEVRRPLPEATVLANVSNDAWFGDSLAPHQHLQIARVRALETGRPLLRATNTGISAIVDADGRLLGTVPHGVRGVITAGIQPRSGRTPYVAMGDLPLVALALGLVVLAWWRERVERPVGRRA